MAFSYNPGKLADAKDQLEKQLFKEVQTLIRYIESRKKVAGNPDHFIMQSYERMVQERCDALGSIARR